MACFVRLVARYELEGLRITPSATYVNFDGNKVLAHAATRLAIFLIESLKKIGLT